MITQARVLAIVLIYLLTLVAWEVLASITSTRTDTQQQRLTGDVQELWGSALIQSDPDVRFHWVTTETKVVQMVNEKTQVAEDRAKLINVDHETPLSPDQTEVSVDLNLDQRLKGLVWYSLYGITFDGTWQFTNRDSIPGDLEAFLKLPDPGAMYDEFRFEIDGVDRTRALDTTDKGRGQSVSVNPGQSITMHVHYRTRGLNDFRYDPVNSNNLTHFHLEIGTDFADIDYPNSGISPTRKTPEAKGWSLEWTFEQVLSGKAMGVVMPSHVQPGKLAADLSTSAPVSLALFFLILLAFSALRGLDIHPINYLAIAAAFFAFQLLFSYSVDHIALGWAFALSSAASIGLVVSYLRLVVSARFAMREAALAQLVYQVGFALAHFWEGYTGLTVAVLATLTLFLVMQLTGSLKWSAVLARSKTLAGAKA